ncbi:MAG TPA: anti-sigma factor [Streptosporangiaceae bacterium]|nr:anti-sigma factor [Streptosporangiaceae bacterium]
MALLRNDQHTLTGVYALDALDTAAEVARFERHMNRCDGCTSEVRGFRETATRLAMAVAQQPPPTLRAAVMADVARTGQVPTADDHARHARRLSRPTLLPRLAMAGAALGLAAAIILAVVLVNTNNQLSQTQQQLGQAQQQLSQAKRHLILAQTQLAAINAVRTAADATLVTKATPIGGRVTIVKSAAKGQLVVTASGLPPLKAGKVYQLWLIGGPGNKIRSEGLLAVHNGRSGPVLISGVLKGDLFGMTVEPAGGTIQPTLATLAITIPAS